MAVDLFDYFFAYFLLIGRELGQQLVYPPMEAYEVHLAEVGNVLAVDEIVERNLVEAAAVAFGAHHLAVELLYPFLCAGREFAVGHLLQVFDDATVLDEVVVGGVDEFGGYAHVAGAALQYLVDGLVGDVADRGVEVAVVGF